MEKGKLFKNYTIVVCIVIALMLLAFLSYRYLAPFGKIVSYRFTSKFPGSQEATTFSPGKDNILKIPAQIITTSRSKLQLKLLSSNVESIKATLKFKPKVNEIILGTRGNEKDSIYYQPLYRDLLHYLDWKRVEEKGFALWQKEQKYQSVSDFVNDPPQDKKIAFYFADLDNLKALKSDETQTREVTKTLIEIPLRGNHTFLIRVDQKPLLIKIAKQDTNSYEGEDKLKITVLKEEKILIEETIGDDGITDVSRLKTEPQEESVTLEDIEPAIYQVNLSDESGKGDTLITKIETNQSKVILKNSVFLLGSKPTAVWTNSQKVEIATFHDIGLQTVKLNDNYDLKIDEKGKNYSFDLATLTGNKDANKLYKLVSPKNDLIINGNGYFSFSEEAFLFPDIIKGVDLNTLNNLQDVDYILTTYPSAKKEGDWLIAETTFDPKKINIEGDKLYFSLEVPQIAKYGGELEIDYLEIAVKSKGILEKEGEEKRISPPPEVKERKKIPFLETTTSNLAKIKNDIQKTTGNALEAVKEFPVNIFNKVKLFLVSSYQKVFHRLPTKMEEASTPTPTPTALPTLSPTPMPTPSLKQAMLIRVFNGGAEEGAAGKFAEVLKTAGFANVKVDNADNHDYKDAILRYRAKNKKEAGEIGELLKKDYKTISQTEVSTIDAEIIVILGKK